MLSELLAFDGVVESCLLRGAVGVMALHGGLEAGTAELARELAEESDVSLYTVVQPPSLWWHVPSTRYDPSASDRLAAFVEHTAVSISIHGFGRPGMADRVLVGGSNRELAGAIGDVLRGGGIDAVDDLDRIPSGLRGMHAANPVNLTSDGGAQLELGSDLRTDAARVRLVQLLVPLLDEWSGS